MEKIFVSQIKPDFDKQFIEENNPDFEKQFIKEQRGAMLNIVGNDSSLIELDDMRNNPIGTSLILESPKNSRDGIFARSINS